MTDVTLSPTPRLHSPLIVLLIVLNNMFPIIVCRLTIECRGIARSDAMHQMCALFTKSILLM